jgi:murein DD-endopeptidase MepM/ murein hydrolase activator NlpD
LATTTAVAVALSLGAPARVLGAAAAQEAEPSPTQSSEDPSPSPTPSDTPTPTPDPTETPTPTPTPDSSPDPSPDPSPSPSPDPKDPDNDDDDKNKRGNDRDKDKVKKDDHAKRKKQRTQKVVDKCKRAKKKLQRATTKKAKRKFRKKRDKHCPDVDVDEPTLPEFLDLVDAYDTDSLVAASARLMALGWSKEDAAREVFAPFIVGGKANWIDTWGAPRYGPGPIVRTHEGQDVFCEYGDPVLASEKGTIEYDEGGLGGIIARLYRPDGSYWYYAHLSETNEDQYPTGTTVRPGDVIGYCGNSGNAITTPPHVHFGWYGPNGEAWNTMRPLVRWLREAERRAGIVVSRAQGKRVDQIGTYLAARRFGDAFVPGLAEIGEREVSIWEVSTETTTEALKLAQGALLAMVAGEGPGPELSGMQLAPGGRTQAESGTTSVPAE